MGSEGKKGEDGGSLSSTLTLALLLRCFLSFLDFHQQEPVAPRAVFQLQAVSRYPDLEDADTFVHPLATALRSSPLPAKDVTAVTSELSDDTLCPTQKMLTRLNLRLKIQF